MNERGASGILSSKVKLGADASVAAGPVGRDASAETDATLRADILSYFRARGAFAGVALEGSTIRPDGGANEQIYGAEDSCKADRAVRESRDPTSCPETDFDTGRQDSKP
jgi:lipid-binding SYLF domain-containing protein